MEYDDFIAQLEYLRVVAEQDRFIAAAHQLEAWIGYLRMRPRIFSIREAAVYEGAVPGESWEGES